MKLFWILFLFELLFVITKSQSQRINKGNGRAQRRQAAVEKAPSNTPIFFDRLSDVAGDNCKDGNGSPGSCMNIYECKSVLNDLNNRRSDPAVQQYVRRSICNAQQRLICCPLPKQQMSDKITLSAPTVRESCGVTSSSHKKVIGGQNAKKGSWPWIALLRYDEPQPFRCGGTLITARHVLTAAHCLSPTLTHVRLGEHDLSTNTEAVHVDMEIDRSIRHPEYNRVDMRGDLAILFLKANAPLDNHITPICLPSTPQLRRKSYLNFAPFIAGWGQTKEGGSTSSILQELQIPIRKNEECATRYARLNFNRSANQFDAAVICAGILTGGEDSCKGDSGGPLMIPEADEKGVHYYYILGVISYGIGCARANVPGVYTSVQYFMDWILKQIATGA